MNGTLDQREYLADDFRINSFKVTSRKLSESTVLGILTNDLGLVVWVDWDVPSACAQKRLHTTTCFRQGAAPSNDRYSCTDLAILLLRQVLGSIGATRNLPRGPVAGKKSCVHV